MSGWVKIPETWFEEERIESLSAPAIVLHLSALADCARHLRDGRLPRQVLRRLWPAQDVPAVVAELETAELWQPNALGWYLPTWDTHLLSAEEVEKRREQSRETSERYRRHKAGDHSLCSRCSYVRDQSRDASRHTSRDASVIVPEPNRSDPKGRRGEEDAEPGRADGAPVAAHRFIAPADEPEHCGICGRVRADHMEVVA